MGVREVVYAIERWFPEVERPKRHVPPLKEKFMWTGIALLLYFVLAEIPPLYGIPPQQVQDYFATLRFVLAGRSGSLLTLGIGPIVTASIIMQLLVGSEIVRLDLSNPEDRRFYQATQRVFAVFMSFFEAFIYVFAGAFGKVNTGIGAFQTVSIPQRADLHWNRPCTPHRSPARSSLDTAHTPGRAGEQVGGHRKRYQPLHCCGCLPDGYLQIPGSRSEQPVHRPAHRRTCPGRCDSCFHSAHPQRDISGAIYRGGTLPDIVKLIGTIVVFLVVVYLESMRVEIPPLSYGRVTVRGRYPIRFMYVSNIPIILTMHSTPTYSSGLGSSPTTATQSLASSTAQAIQSVVSSYTSTRPGTSST